MNIDLTDPDMLISIYNRNGGGWNGWGAVAKAIETAQNALSEPPVNSVDQDLAYNILALQREVEQLKARLDSVESLTRPIGNAKVRGEELFSTGKAALDLTSRIIHKKGTW